MENRPGVPPSCQVALASSHQFLFTISMAVHSIMIPLIAKTTRLHLLDQLVLVHNYRCLPVVFVFSVDDDDDISPRVSCATDAVRFLLGKPFWFPGLISTFCVAVVGRGKLLASGEI